MLSLCAIDVSCWISSATAKGSIHVFACYLAHELGPLGIRVNVVLPGLMDTPATARVPQKFKDMVAAATPAGRYAQPQDVGRIIVFLCEPESDYLTGNKIQVNGGFGIARAAIPLSRPAVDHLVLE